MDLSVVNHEDYFAKIGDDHKFPINKFGELANYLLKKKIVNKFHKPLPCSEETLKRAHSEEYIKNVKNKTLDENTIKNIVSSNKKTPRSFKSVLNSKGIDVTKISMDEYKKQVIACYTEYLLNK